MTILAIISVLLFVPSHVYNMINFTISITKVLDTQWEATRNGIYAAGYVITILLGMVVGGGVMLYVIHFWHDNETVMMVVASLALLLSSYFSYYQRFGKSLWAKRFLYS